MPLMSSPWAKKAQENGFDVLVSNQNISLVTMKKSDKREGYILRFINNYPYTQETNLTVGKVTKNLAFGKYEVKTFFYDGQLHELDTMEI